MATPAEALEDHLGLSPEVSWYLESRGIPFPTGRPLISTPEPSGVEGALFDPDRVDRVLTAFSLLRHTQGRWAGQPLNPDPWQIAFILAPVFGWVRWDEELGDHVRIISSLYVEVPRKNGKTTLLGGVGLYLTCADREQGAQVVTAATTEKQAGYLFTPVKQLARSSPALKPHTKALAKKIIHTASNSYMEVVSSVAEALHGGNIHGGLIDELHVHKDPALVETIETGTGSRSQPLVAIITTADDGRQDTIYSRKRDFIEKLARGVIMDATTYGVVFSAETSDDPFSEVTWRKANPGYGVSPTRSYMERASAKAQQSPADLATFLRLHLGIRTHQETRYIDLPVWDRNCGAPILEADLKGREAFGGLDLASTSDLCSLCWLFPDDHGGVDAIWRHWVPQRAFQRINDRTAGMAEVWRREGLLTVTPGDVADYGFIQAQINLDREQFYVHAIGFDRWNASQLVNDLLSDGAPMVQLGQGFASMSAPLKHIQHLLLQGTEERPMFHHGGNGLMRWQTDNLAVATDPAGNVKPDKKASGDKIDGISAATDAMAMVLASALDFESAYSPDRGVEVI